MLHRNPYSDMTDESLMAKNQEGDQQAFAMLYDRYSGRMMAYFFRMLWSDRERAADMTQDLFAKLIKYKGSFEQGKRFSTWVYSIARNMCKNEYRHEEIKSRHREAKGDMPDSTSSQVDLDHSLFKEELDEHLKNLDQIKRSVFIIRFKQHLSIKEIADVMECSEGTIKSRIFYSLKELAANLKEYDPKRTR